MQSKSPAQRRVEQDQLAYPFKAVRDGTHPDWAAPVVPEQPKLVEVKVKDDLPKSINGV